MKTFIIFGLNVQWIGFKKILKYSIKFVYHFLVLSVILIYASFYENIWIFGLNVQWIGFKKILKYSIKFVYHFLVLSVILIYASFYENIYIWIKCSMDRF